MRLEGKLNLLAVGYQEEVTMTLDFVVTDQTGVWLFEPLTEEAKNFIREKVGFDECFWQAQSLVVDYRDAGVLSEDLRDEGFVVATRH
jgi:hypothetical protein